ncbi:nucleotidyltransferase [Chitinophaga sp. CF418]|uniref:SMODS domain-containing nucleotidyltransferase n=1 Tax=Chitinophaga sp. CF418 TaxID=1855287 RepID=UPI00091A81E2|nr:nucleotidyltransferase [Chitinophaga sp. CF418]SHN24980.1 hypothetical protein SAMN05216311_107298 [Chitinophaga sp. CF418]
MATTVLQAFEEFLRIVIRIDPEENKKAKASKDELLRQILKLPEDPQFPLLFDHIQYGSYARKTKTRPLNDIDLMIVLDGQGSKYDIQITPTHISNIFDSPQLRQFTNGDNRVNSIKVINTFIKYLSKVPLYKKADFKKNGEAAVLELQSYNWVYDIVPCFITKPEYNGRTYFLIPDAKGGWKKTDPRIDKARVESVNASQKVSILDVIRLAKYWNARNTMATMESYLMENMVLDFFDGRSPNTLPDTVRGCFLRVLEYIKIAVHNTVADPKGIQGNLNNLSLEEKRSIAARAETDFGRAYQAMQFEVSAQHNLAINTWRQIFGNNFPTYP